MQEKNRHILEKVIASLQSRMAPAGIWLKISQRLDESNEKGKEHLERAKENVRKEHVKAPDIWDQIANSLDQNTETGESKENNIQVLKEAINSLPRHHAPDDLFENIINPPKVQKGKTIRRFYRVSGVAATILLIVTLGIWKKSFDGQNTVETITYSEETVSQAPDQFSALLSSFEQEDEVIAFVEANCLQIEIKCDSDEFKGLLLQYKELDTVKQNLMVEISLHQEQVQLIDYLIRVEKEKTEVGKKLIQYLLS